MSKKLVIYSATYRGVLWSLLLCYQLVCVAQKKPVAPGTTYDPISQDVIIKDNIYPSIKSIKVVSGQATLPVLQYYPTGKGPHPTLILLHGYTGMAGNVDVATTLSRAGWNVLFFRYRGSWGMPGEFTFQNCIDDAVNIATHVKLNARLLHVDTSRLVLFGHSMGGWVALKAAARLPFIKKVFALSTWDIYPSFAKAEANGTAGNWYKEAEGYPELTITSGKALYKPVLSDSLTFKLPADLNELADTKLFFLDEHTNNKDLVTSYKKHNLNVTYEVWKSDHSFTYTRIAMLRKLLAFIDE
ncbi:alpha/beta hydrolase family protein [Fibrella arboris]|uniref:alpha/beta hydrolase family protein n=1 Tax=Fibrella arboris TaxID=3242486 RepID=UPI0035201823